jgi:ELWxxDGT repeat protein
LLLCISGTALADPIVRVADINPGAGDSDPYGMVSYNGDLYFVADDGTHGEELMKYDGTSVTRLTDINSGGDSDVRNLHVYNNELYFGAYDGAQSSLWKYDGTSASQIINSADGQPLHMVWKSSPRDSDRMATFNGKLYLEGYSDELGSRWGFPQTQLWEYDASTGAATRVSDIHTLTWDWKNLIGSFSPEELTLYDGKLMMTGMIANYQDPVAQTGTIGTELWQYDGTNLTRLSDFTGQKVLDSLYTHDGTLYMSADMDGTTGSEIVSYDGSTFTLVNDAIPGVVGGGAGEFASYNGDLYYVSSDSYQLFGSDPFPDNQELWMFDGLTASEAADINLTGSFPSSFPQDLVEFDGELFFSAATGDLFAGQADRELWAWDGTAASLFADVNPFGSGSVRELFVHNGMLFFSADDGTGGQELFVVQEAPIPEPATMALLALGGLGLAIRHRRS